MNSINGKLLWTTSWVFVLLAALVSPIAASATPATERDYNFDTSENLTDNFNIKVGPQTNLSQISVEPNWGLNGSGGLKIDIGSGDPGNRAVIFSTKERYTVKNSPIDSVYKFSLYARSHESGYAGIGFTANADDSTSGFYPDYYTPKDALGVSMHGGAFIIHNGNQTIERSWNSGSGEGVTALTVATCSFFIDSPEFVPPNATHDDCASPSGWYRLDMTLTKKSATTFDLKLEVFRSSSTGDISSTGLAADTSSPDTADAAFEILGLSNPAIGNSGSLASYINMSGKRFPQIDGYKIELAGATFVTGPSVPGTPTATPKMTTVAPIVGEVELEWTEPTSGDAPFTYEVTSEPPLPAGASCTVTGVKASCVGLTDGEDYSFFVEASNDGGSEKSAASAQVTFPFALPGTPGAPTAVAGNGSATVSVVAPSSGGAVASYTVTASPGGATCTVTPPATSCVVSGLTNGTSYTFSSTATNTSGTSAATSANSNAVTPLAPPGVPGTPTAVAGNGSATVTVVAPSSGGAVASYTVTASPGGATCTVTPPATSCVVSGLTNGTSYTFSSTATNASGTSAASSTSAAVIPARAVATNKTVSFSGNGGVGPKYTFKANKSVKLPANKFTRKGYVFAGWNTKADGSGTAYKDQATFKFTANATLYAQWTVVKAAKRIAIFKGDVATLSNDMKYTIRTWISKLPAGASVTCEGSTAGLKVTAFDKTLAKNRAKNVCEYAKSIKKGLKYTLTTNPSSANDIQARHVWMRSN